MKESERILNRFIKMDVTKCEDKELQYHSVTLKTALQAIEVALNQPKKSKKVAPAKRQASGRLIDLDDVCLMIIIDYDEEIKSVNEFEFMEAVQKLLSSKKLERYIGGKRSFRVSDKRINEAKTYLQDNIWRRDK